MLGILRYLLLDIPRSSVPQQCFHLILGSSPRSPIFETARVVKHIEHVCMLRVEVGGACGGGVYHRMRSYVLGDFSRQL